MNDVRHEAYEWGHLLKIAAPIESMASYDNKLLVGTKAGHLLMYEINTKHDKKLEVAPLKFGKLPIKKPVQQLAIVSEHNIVVVLSDGVISLHDLMEIGFNSITTIQKTKGATSFSLDVKRHTSLTGGTVATVRMCVALKRSLQLYYLKNRDFLELSKDITLPDTPKSIEWCNDTIFIGYKGSYALVNVGEKPQELFPTSRTLEHIVTKVSDNTVALIKENQSIFMLTSGEPASGRRIQWSQSPLAVVYDEPYLISLLPDSVEVKSWSSESITQSIDIKGKVICHGKRGSVFIAQNEEIWMLSSIPLHKQIKLLLQDKRFELALKLANISDDEEEEKRRNIHQIQTLYAFHLFENKKYDESMEQFLKLDTDPYEVIRLFPNLLSSQQRNETKMEKLDMDSGILALINYLTEVRMKQKKDDPDMELRSTQQLMQIVDTTLLKCYLQTNDALVAPLLRRNFCNLEEAEKTLKKNHKYDDLVILYQTKGLHFKALELLLKLAEQGDLQMRGYSHLVKYLQNLGQDHMELIFQFATHVIEKNPMEGLKIFTEDIPEVEQLPRPKVLDYLLKTEKKSLVIEYLEHVIRVWKETNHLFHNALVHQYRERIQELGHNEPEAHNLKSRLISFLEKDEYYSPGAVIAHFPGDCLFEERAIINGKLGRHEHALAIYVSLLSDFQGAIKYCDKVYTEKRESYKHVYVQLVRLLISPPDTLPGVTAPLSCTPDLETALTLLEAFPERVSPAEALKELPDSVPVSRIRHFLNASITALVHNTKKSQLLSGVLRAQYHQAQQQKMEHESMRILMTESMLCPVCKKRFGNQSAFVRLPTGEVVHFSCQDK